MTVAGRVYSHRQFVGGADVGPEGVAHLDAIAGWLQDAAFADAFDAGLGTGSGWIVRRTSLVVERLPRFAEQLKLRTWCGGLAASTAERLTRIEGDRGGLIEASAIWVHIDPESRRPARFTPEFLAVYAESAGEARPRTKLTHPGEPAPDSVRSTWRFSRSDIDLAGHVNNAVYWRILEDSFGDAGVPEGGAVLEAEYRGGIVAGDATVARSGPLCWVLDAEGQVGASLSRSGDRAT